VEIRRLGKGDGALLREIRLRALREAPYAFSSWLEREAGFGQEIWDDRVARSELGETAVFVAVEDGRTLGTVSGYFAAEEREVATLVGMWVEPATRRRGIGRELVEAVAAWARDSGVRRLRVAVTDCEASRPAAALYLGLGFVETGEREPLESDRSLVAVVMSRSL
jgi:GNAT superfamily N-acetyltransferase